MSTTHYEFPTINGTDAINGVDAINGLANAVDTALYAVDSTVSGQSTDIATALSTKRRKHHVLSWKNSSGSTHCPSQVTEKWTCSPSAHSISAVLPT